MRFLKLFFVVCIIVLPVSVAAEKAKTIEELAAMYDSSRCKECHAEIYARWENSHHARSLMGVQDGLMMTPLAIKGLAFFP
jgi:hypothetical protein